ncbi:MAG: Minf_1886 family protein [Verrucomicrobiales bacterium]
MPQDHEQTSFEEHIRLAREADPRFEADAYLFLRDALDLTVREIRKKWDSEDRHVSGPELLDGFRRLALQQFGPMVPTVLEAWGIRCTDDIGDMVFNLIEIGAFGKNESDSKEDFIAVYDFHDAFIKPFLPENRLERESEP